GDRSGVKRRCAEYKRRRDALCSGLRSLGWDVTDSAGTMFVWARVPDDSLTSAEFAERLIERAGVMCTPGSAFGPSGEGYVRFALVKPVEVIDDAVSRMKNL
ncbi:MAG TPA: aminotransferase class I/II-fold pyridoxal phosphate-dependent enzyme, partial [Candidatus Protoclostridium stercorigallinarum]|nr:aminotransferase class I/II-fold pyridoxal phosphate-dependent enzyme [Candidatus Protoclostridium stercorigallinarum]